MRILIFICTALYVLLELAFRFKFLEIAGQPSFNPKSIEIIEVIGRGISSFGISMLIAQFMLKRKVRLKLTTLIFVVSLISSFQLQKALINHIGLVTPKDFYRNAPEIFVMKNNVVNTNKFAKTPSDFIFNFNDSYDAVDKSMFINLPIYMYKNGSYTSENESVMKINRKAYAEINTAENLSSYLKLSRRVSNNLKKEHKNYLKVSKVFENKTNDVAFNKQFEIFKSMIIKKSVLEFESYRKSILSVYIKDIHNYRTLRNKALGISHSDSFSRFNNVIGEIQTFGRSNKHEIDKFFKDLTKNFSSVNYYTLSSILDYNGYNTDFDSFNKNGIVHNTFKRGSIFNQLVVGDDHFGRDYRYKFKKTKENTLDDYYINDYFEEVYVKNRKDLKASENSKDGSLKEYNKKLLSDIDDLYLHRLNYINILERKKLFKEVSFYSDSIKRKINNPNLRFSEIKPELLNIQHIVATAINENDFNFKRDINDFNDFIKTDYFQEAIKYELRMKGLNLEGNLNIKNERQLKALFMGTYNKNVNINKDLALSKLNMSSIPFGLDFDSFISHKEVVNKIKEELPFLVYGNELLLNDHYSDIKDKLTYNLNRMTYNEITNAFNSLNKEDFVEYNKGNIVPIFVLYISTIVLLLNIYGLIVFFVENKKVKLITLLIYLSVAIIPAFQSNEYSEKGGYSVKGNLNRILTWEANLSDTIEHFEPIAFPFIVALDHAEIFYIHLKLDRENNHLNRILYSKRRGELVRKLRALDLY